VETKTVFVEPLAKAVLPTVDKSNAVITGKFCSVKHVCAKQLWPFNLKSL
jgi:hypothetical protein